MRAAFLKRVPSSISVPALLALAAFVAVSPAAKADQFSFSFSGGGIFASGIITTSSVPVPGVPGAFQVIGATGTFSDTTAGIASTAITGVQTTSLPSGINPDGTFVPPGTAAGGSGFSYDNLFYPAGNSPAVCPPPGPGDPEPPFPYGGGLLDIYGVLFTTQGGYNIDVWSNGVIPGFGLTYGVGDSLNGVVLTTYGEPFSGTSVGGTVTPIVPDPVPEPESLVLLGTGMLGLIGTVARKMKASIR
jgi:PEP-CTERM motif